MDSKDDELNEMFKESWLEKCAGCFLIVIVLALMYAGALWISHISKVMKEQQSHPVMEQEEK